MVFGLAGQMQGQRARVSRSLTRWLVDRSVRDPSGEINVAQTLAFMSYIAVDPPATGGVVERARRVAAASGPANLASWSDYLDGLLHLQRGELELALPLLDPWSRKYLHQVRNAVDAMCAQVLGYQVHGKPEQADAALESLREFIRDSHSSFDALGEACAVRLALARGDRQPAIGWLRTSPLPADEAMLWWFEIPSITWCRALIAEGSEAHLRAAEARLREHAAVNERHHNACQLIPILCLLAVARTRLGQVGEARSALGQALMLAEAGGFVFPFREAGAGMTDLLVMVGGDYEEFVDRVLRPAGATAAVAPSAPPSEASSEPAAVRHSRPALAGARAMAEVLTNRELDILELLAERLQNKEIADRLSIAPETVNYHLKHIYQKLNVQSRRQAVTCASELGLLEARGASQGGQGSKTDTAANTNGKHE
jgi:LuxR family maltose regulon positive regulatory protein